MENVIKMQNMTEDEQELVKYCKFYMAMILNEILKETPVAQIADMFKLKRGDIQSL